MELLKWHHSALPLKDIQEKQEVAFLETACLANILLATVDACRQFFLLVFTMFPCENSCSTQAVEYDLTKCLHKLWLSEAVLH